MNNQFTEELIEVQDNKKLKEAIGIQEKHKMEFTKEIQTSIRNAASACYKKSLYLHRHMDFDDIYQELSILFLEENEKNGFANMAHVNWFLKCRETDIGRKQRNDNSTSVESIYQFFDENSQDDKAPNPEVGYEISVNYNRCERGEDNVILYDMIEKLTPEQKTLAVVRGYLCEGLDQLGGMYKELSLSNPEGFKKLEDAVEQRSYDIRDGKRVKKALSDDVIFKTVYGLAGVYSCTAVGIKNSVKDMFNKYQEEAVTTV